MQNERQFESIREPYTDKELADFKELLVTAVGEVKTLRAEKAQVLNTLGASIKQAESRVWDLQEKVSLGYRLVDTEVFTVMDEPEPGKKKIIRVDNNECLRVEFMTPREKQQNFGFTAGEEDVRPPE